jgi:hypothetical protein
VTTPTKCARTRLTIAFGLLALLLAPPVHAQQVAATFQELQGLIKPGETIYVTEAGGATSKGMLARLSATSLQLQVQQDASARSVNLSERDVNNIVVKRFDSLQNGMLIGFIAGAAPVALLGAGSSASGGEVAGVAAGYGGLGLVAGLLIDIFNREKVTVYVHSPSPQSARMHVSPLVSKSSAGVLIGWRSARMSSM